MNKNSTGINSRIAFMDLQKQLDEERARREEAETATIELQNLVETMQRQMQDIKDANRELENQAVVERKLRAEECVRQANARARLLAQLDAFKQQKKVEDCIKCRDINIFEPILYYIKFGDNERIKSIMENSHLFHATDHSRTTLLHYAASYGNSTITAYLLKKGSAVNAQNSMGMTPLMMAVQSKREEIILTLLANGADILIVNKENKSALHMFCAQHEFSYGVREIFFQELKKKFSSSQVDVLVDTLINAGCHLYQAAYLKNTKILELVRERGSFPIHSMHPRDRDLVLHLAVAGGDVECVKSLLKYGANAKLRDTNGGTALFYLYQYNTEHSHEKTEILKILLNLGVSLTSCTSNGNFQVQPILMKGSREKIELILKSYIDLKATDNIFGRYVLHYLAMNMSPGVVELLKIHRKKFDVNVLDNNGTNPLYWAVKIGNADMVAFLLSEGAEVNIAHRRFGFTPLYYAYIGIIPGYEEKYARCVELLLQNSADAQFTVTFNDGQQTTLFEFPSTAGNFKKIKPVIAHLAIQEVLAKAITEVTYSKINSRRLQKKYLNTCRQLLRQKIAGSVSLFKLFTDDKKKIAKYLRNKELVLKLRRVSFKRKVRTSYSYYHNTLKKRYLEGVYYNRLRDNAAEWVCDIFENKLDKENLIVEKIIDCLNNQSLESLCRLSK